MAPNPVVATYRISWPITVDGQSHVQRFYIRATPAGGSYDITPNDGGATLTIAGVINQLATDFSSAYTADASWGNIGLEHRVGTVWNPVFFVLPTDVLGQHSGAYFPAGELSIVLRDSLFRKIRIPLMETFYGPPLHSINYLAGDAYLDLVLTALMAPPNRDCIGNWLVSKSNLELTGFVSYTATDNRRLRRNRGTI